jgi:hypothetical protein
MYWSGNFCVKDGKPVDAGVTPGPYDPNTWNAGCNTFYGDRIWMTWHFGDGLLPTGWDAGGGTVALRLGMTAQDPPFIGLSPDGAVAPFLALPAGGNKEQSLIGDPSVVYWNNKWHMYYEGTDYCDGTNNLLFHATADSWFGPWTKQGRVWGVLGHIENVGLSWPTAFVENGDLYLYYTNAMQRLTCAKANEPTGQYFDMMNQGKPVTPSYCARGQILSQGGVYYLISDIQDGKGINLSISDNIFDFPPPTKLFGNEILGDASANSVGLPTALFDTDGLRIYFTTRPNGTDISSIGVAVVVL